MVVVPAAAGGIGTLLVQYARNAGAHVIGLAGGPEKTARVRANGAGLAVDYTAPDWPAEVRAHLAGRPATIVYDGVGGAVAREAAALLGSGGRHLVFGWSADGIGEGRAYLVEGVSQSVLGPAMLEKAGGLRALELRALAEAAEGRLRPAVTRFPPRRGRRRAPGAGAARHHRQGGAGTLTGAGGGAVRPSRAGARWSLARFRAPLGRTGRRPPRGARTVSGPSPAPPAPRP